MSNYRRTSAALAQNAGPITALTAILVPGRVVRGTQTILDYKDTLAELGQTVDVLFSEQTRLLRWISSLATPSICRFLPHRIVSLRPGEVHIALATLLDRCFSLQRSRCHSVFTMVNLRKDHKLDEVASRSQLQVTDCKYVCC